MTPQDDPGYSSAPFVPPGDAPRTADPEVLDGPDLSMPSQEPQDLGGKNRETCASKTAIHHRGKARRGPLAPSPGDQRYRAGHFEIIRSLWPYGDVVDVEQIDENDFAALAMYITKESVEGRPVGAQMWTRSRNLKQPIIESCYVPDDTTLAVPPGCDTLEREEKATEYGSYSYIKYRLPPPKAGQMSFVNGRYTKRRTARQSNKSALNSCL